jgi:hypothetical protein
MMKDMLFSAGGLDLARFAPYCPDSGCFVQDISYAAMDPQVP